MLEDAWARGVPRVLNMSVAMTQEFGAELPPVQLAAARRFCLDRSVGSHGSFGDLAACLDAVAAEVSASFRADGGLPPDVPAKLCRPMAEHAGFWSQGEAFRYFQDCIDRRGYPAAALGIFAEELTMTGQRRYVVDTKARFAWRQAGKGRGRPRERPHWFEMILEQSPRCLYFDLEYSTAANPKVCPENIMRAFHTELAEFVEKVQPGFRIAPEDWVELDSSSATKFSRHVIYRGQMAALVLRRAGPLSFQPSANLVFAGHDNLRAFIEAFRRHLESDRTQPPKRPGQLLTVRKNDGSNTSLVDWGVYTRNRTFRVLHSTKFGKDVPFTVVRQNWTKHVDAADPWLFLYSLASFVPSGQQAWSLPSSGFLSVPPTNVEPVTRISRASEPSGALVEANRSKTGASEPDRRSSSTKHRLAYFLTSFWQEVHRRWEQGLPPVNTEVAEEVGLQAVSSCPSNTSTVVGATCFPDGRMKIDLNNCYCAHRGRPHRRNRVYIVGCPISRRFWQSCYDTDCRRTRDRSVSFPLPHSLFPIGDD